MSPAPIITDPIFTTIAQLEPEYSLNHAVSNTKQKRKSAWLASYKSSIKKLLPNSTDN